MSLRDLIPWNIAPWNRREVYTGFSNEEFNKARAALAEHGIRYDCKVVNPTRSRGTRATPRASISTPFVNQKYASQYYLYVNNKDYDAAARWLRQ